MIAAEAMLAPTDVATLLKCSEQKVWYLTKRGVMPGIRVGRAWRYRRSDIEAFLDSQRGAAAPRTAHACSEKKQ